MKNSETDSVSGDYWLLFVSRKTSDQDDQELIDIVSSSEEENKDESKNTPIKVSHFVQKRNIM